MTDLILPRRKFLTGLAALVAAPTIVRAASLMPVRKLPKGLVLAYDSFGNEYETYTCWFRMCEPLVLEEWRYVAKLIDCDLLRA